MYRKIIFSLLLIVIFIFTLAACNNNTKNESGGELNRYNTTPNWDNPRNNNYTSSHNNTRMEMSDEIAREITRMQEVDSAYVLLTDKNAYVAVVLDGNQQNNGKGNRKGNNNNRNNNMGNVGSMNNYMNNNSMGNNGIGNMSGTMNRNHRDRFGSVDGTNENPLNYRGDLGTRDMNMSRNYKGTTIRGTDGLNNRGVEDRFTPSDISQDVKSRISDKVKSVKPNVRNVYVSANPDFVDRMNGYSTRFSNGQPLRGMIIEFNTMVERIFPSNMANNQAPIIRNMNPPR